MVAYNRWMVLSVAVILFMVVLLSQRKVNVERHLGAVINRFSAQRPQPTRVKTVDFKEFEALHGVNCSSVLTKTRRPYKICIHPAKADIFISANLKLYGKFESDLSESMARLGSKYNADIIVDIGANIGVHTLYMASLGFDVIAVEPSPSNLNLLVRSVIINQFQDRVTVVPLGVSSSRHTVTMKTSAGNFGNTYIPDNYTRGKTAEAARTFDISLVVLEDLASLLPKDGSAVVMKVDVERHECEVFKGFESLIRTVNVTVAVMEWLYDYQECRAGMIDEFVRLGYAARAMDGAWIKEPKSMLKWDFDTNIYWERLR